VKRAIAQLIFGVAQTMGATMGVYFLITTGTSKMTIGAVGATALVSVLSRMVFGVLWKKAKLLDSTKAGTNDVKRSKPIKASPMFMV
jgi:hypothetical protein